ncbi:hypothetical protein [Amycolatopsis taiwanensis]|uniref:hypothetical protein n=1 Tax=Amycolatopsis taiwanensis TaxID=342230 RepID=UPI000694EEF6|nr:hypothetical protein [Amycolatopsis taiwanensis]
MLEQKIWERNETLLDFVEYSNRLAREIGEPGTLSERNLKRLVSGQKPNGQPIGRPRPATARLLEQILGISIDELLSPVAQPSADSQPDLRQMLSASQRVDAAVLALLRAQLDAMRQLDRRLGAVVAHGEVTTKIGQVRRLLSHSLTPGSREQLAALLSEMCTLAGWQALDLGNVAESWQHYEHAKSAAKESGSPAFEAHAEAEQAFVLIDLGETATAVDLLLKADRRADKSAARLLRAWLAAALGEALAANGQPSAGLRSFDRAESLLPPESSSPEGPYVALDPIHLARWRGNVLARIGEPEAIDVLTSALSGLDPTFTRAETALRVDLATAFSAMGKQEQARMQLTRARSLALGIGSTRHQRRIKRLAGLLRQ